jgi:hypothetical protein
LELQHWEMSLERMRLPTKQEISIWVVSEAEQNE